MTIDEPTARILSVRLRVLATACNNAAAWLEACVRTQEEPGHPPHVFVPNLLDALGEVLSLLKKIGSEIEKASETWKKEIDQ